MPTATFNVFYEFKEAMAEKLHNFSTDVIKIALCASGNEPSISSNTVKADLTEISYINTSGLTVSTNSSNQTSGVYTLALADHTIMATGGDMSSFQYITLYNDTASNDELIGYYDYGSGLVLASGQSLVIGFDTTSGLFSMT